MLMHHGISGAMSYKIVFLLLFVVDVTGRGGGACDPGAQAADHPQPGEEAGGVRAGAEPTQPLAFLLVSTAAHTHVACMSCHVHAPPSHPYPCVMRLSSHGLGCAERKREE